MTSSLHWQQTSPGTYQRDFDGVERYYLSASLVKSPAVNKADLHLNAGVKLECSRPRFVTDLKKACIQTRFDYPGLAATIIGDKWIYRTADLTELAHWLEETFQVHREPLTAREALGPAPRVVLHVLPDTQELMIQGPHTHMDGFELMKTFQHLISCMVRLPLSSGIVESSPVDFGSEARKLSLPMSLTCQTPPCSAEDKQKWDTLMEDFIESITLSFPIQLGIVIGSLIVYPVQLCLLTDSINVGSGGNGSGSLQVLL